jgi:GNAT superfamily N-acetyltransferase
MQVCSIRQAVSGDLDALVALGAEYCAADGHRFDADTVRVGFDGLLRDDARGVVLVAELDDLLVGYGAVTWGWSIEIGGLDVVLDELYVRSQGHGIGSALITAIEADCRRRGVRRIFLETERPNEHARRLYARHGWVVDDSIWMSKELH